MTTTVGDLGGLLGWLAASAALAVAWLAKVFLGDPLIAFRRLRREVDRAETDYGDVLGNTAIGTETAEKTARRDAAAKELRRLGVELPVEYDAVPTPARLAFIVCCLLPRRRALDAAARALVGLSNCTRPRPNSADLRHNDRAREIARGHLGLPFRSPPRHVRVRGRWLWRRVEDVA